MAANLIDTAKGLVTPELVNEAATTTGESPASASKALHGAVTTIFAALAHRSSTPEGASAVMAMVHAGAAPGLLEKLGRAESASEELASSAGIKSSSASKILELAAPLVAAVLGEEVASRGMNAGGLSQLLSRHETAVLEDAHELPVPSEALGAPPISEIEAKPAFESDVKPVTETRASVTGASRFHDVEQQAATRFRDLEHRVSMTADVVPWKIVAPALAVLAMVVIGIAASTHSHGPHLGVTAMQRSAPAATTVHPPTFQGPSIHAPAPRTAAGVTLPGGKTLDVAAGSSEANFAHALADPSVALPHSFRFDDLTFPAASFRLGAGADNTIDAVAATLHAYPSARVRVEGHSGDVGSPGANRALAAARARAVRSMLIARGVAPGRIETTRGRRPRMAPGKAEAGAKENRRADIVLLRR
jgi:outer membrane protein OmpA-like peptidoglycan-associated protein